MSKANSMQNVYRRCTILHELCTYKRAANWLLQFLRKTRAYLFGSVPTVVFRLTCCHRLVVPPADSLRLRQVFLLVYVKCPVTSGQVTCHPANGCQRHDEHTFSTASKL